MKKKPATGKGMTPNKMQRRPNVPKPSPPKAFKISNQSYRPQGK